MYSFYMKTISVHWVRLDNWGTVKAAFRGVDGRLYYPKHVGAVWADLRDVVKRNNPNTPFDVETCGAVYEIGGARYVCEACSSKVFKPLASFLSKIASRNPVVGTAAGGLNYRSQIISVDSVSA